MIDAAEELLKRRLDLSAGYVDVVGDPAGFDDRHVAGAYVASLGSVSNPDSVDTQRPSAAFTFFCTSRHTTG